MRGFSAGKEEAVQFGEDYLVGEAVGGEQA